MYQSIILENEYIRKGTESDFKTLEHILKLTNFINKNILDLGCFNGYFCFQAINHGANKVVGIDINQPALDICRKLSIYNNYYQINNGELTLNKELYFYKKDLGIDNIFDITTSQIDLVLVLNVFHHIINSQGLEKAKKLLNDLFNNSKEIIFEVNEKELNDIETIANQNNFKLVGKVESHRKTMYGNRWILNYKISQ
jgi:ribosomal protein L11 methylase PrmA